MSLRKSNLEQDFNILPEDPHELKKIIFQLNNQLSEKTNELTELQSDLKDQRLEYLEMEEKYLSIRNLFFARSSEKLSDEDQKQLKLFNEAEEIQDESEENNAESIPVKPHSRKKAGRKPLPKDLPRKEVIHDLDESEKQCSCCGKELAKIGQEESEELDIIPAEIKVIKHIKYKYGPCKCRESKDKNEQQIKTAKAPERLLPGSIASAGLLAFILISKFCDHLPFYRQEKQFKRISVDLSRANMSNWTIKVSEKCQSLIELMWKEVRSGPFIQMDETVLQVLNEPGRSATTQSYMWCTIGYSDSKPLILYHYHPSRSGEIPKELLKDYSGYLQTDGYQGYNKVNERITQVGCWAHARRYFMDAHKLNKKSKSILQALSYINQLFQIEKTLRNRYSDSETFSKEREKQVTVVFDKFHKWLTNKVAQVTPKSKFGQAINYTLNQWPKLVRYIDHHFMTPDNNKVENAIRPFVVGRKNWLFSNTPRGAHASAAIYSLIETAKVNGLEPYRYLRYLFTKLPTVKNEAELKKLLPTELEIDQLATV